MTKRLLTDLHNITLTALQDGKPFEGMAAGEFVDMWGRKVIISKDDLAAYVDNTTANIQATASADGEIVGLPIDSKNHDHGEAAGWIIGIMLNANKDKLLFVPRWTELGIEKISKGLTRYFSPEFSPSALAVTGGSLTNWPASRNKKEEIMLKPIALSVDANGTPSLDDRIQRITTAFYENFTDYSYETYPVEVFDGYLICRDDDKLFRVEYTEMDDDSVEFGPRDGWVEVKRSYIEAALKFVSDIFNRAFTGAKPAPETTQEVQDLDVTKLTPEERANVLAQLTSGANPSAELAQLIDAKANEKAAALLALEQRKAETYALAAGLVGGTPEHPRGLPVDKSALAEFVLSLAPDQAETAKALFSAIQSKGMIEFAETGHGKTVATKAELPAPIAQALRDGKLTVADLSNPMLALGDLSAYDLSEFKKE